MDPADKFLIRAGALAAAGPLIKLHERGRPEAKLDLLILGDGYTAGERAKFEGDAKRLLAVFFATLAATALLYRTIAKGFFPQQDTGTLMLELSPLNEDPSTVHA